jgi:hypothetical protein
MPDCHASNLGVSIQEQASCQHGYDITRLDCLDCCGMRREINRLGVGARTWISTSRAWARGVTPEVDAIAAMKNKRVLRICQ